MIQEHIVSQEAVFSRLMRSLFRKEVRSLFGELGDRYLDGKRRFGTTRTISPEGYFAPSDEEIQREAQKVSLPAWSSGFIRDLCNLAAGGMIAPKAFIQEAITHDSSIKVESAADVVSHEYQIAKFLESVDIKSYAGITPLEKAITFLHLCSLAGSKILSSNEGISPPIFLNTLLPASRTVRNIHDMITLLDSDERELLLADAHPSNSASKNSNTELNQIRRASEELLTSELKRKIAQVALLLKKAPEMGISGESRRDAVPSGRHVRFRRMKGEDELGRLPQSAWGIYYKARPLFWLKIINHEFMVREPVTYVDTKKKQLLYAAIDVSQSMDTPSKIGVALAVLLNRLQGVMKGEAELTYRFFDTGVSVETTVKTQAEAISAMQSLLKANFSGGGTDIGNALDECINAINKKRSKSNLINPDLAIITDGEDPSLLQRTLDRIRLHTFFCGGANSALTKMSQDSDGLVLSLN